jgi:hypothetical protein
LIRNVKPDGCYLRYLGTTILAIIGLELRRCQITIRIRA